MYIKNIRRHTNSFQHKNVCCTSYDLIFVMNVILAIFLVHNLFERNVLGVSVFWLFYISSDRVTVIIMRNAHPEVWEIRKLCNHNRKHTSKINSLRQESLSAGVSLHSGQ